MISQINSNSSAYSSLLSADNRTANVALVESCFYMCSSEQGGMLFDGACCPF